MNLMDLEDREQMADELWISGSGEVLELVWVPPVQPRDTHTRTETCVSELILSHHPV